MMNDNQIIIDYLNNLKSNIDDIKNIVTIEKAIDIIKEQNCIINWDLYHEMKNKGKTPKIETDYNYYKNKKPFDIKDLYTKFDVDETVVSEYVNKIIESTGNGSSYTTFESMEGSAHTSLQKMGFSVEWFNDGVVKGWMVKW